MKPQLYFLSLIFLVFSFLFPAVILADPSVQITAIPSQVTADEQFSITVTVSGLDQNINYRFKSLGRINGDEKLKTLSHDQSEWLTYNGAWNKMPLVTASNEGNISTTIQSKFYDVASGQASVFIRVVKDSDHDTNYNSLESSVTVNPKPSPSPDPSPSPSPSPNPSSTPTPSPSPVTKPSIKPSPSPVKKASPSPTLEPVDFLATPSPRVLGAETTSPSPEASKSAKFNFTKNAIVSWILVGSGLIFLLAAGIPIIRSHFIHKSTPEETPPGDD